MTDPDFIIGDPDEHPFRPELSPSVEVPNKFMFPGDPVQLVVHPGSLSMNHERSTFVEQAEMSFPGKIDENQGAKSPKCHDRENILEQALAVTRGDRQESYGHPAENWKNTVAIFNAMTGRDLTPSEGVKFAIAMKLSRLKNAPFHRDSMVDLAGYAWVYSEVSK